MEYQNIKTLKEQVGHVLKNYPDSRNDDTLLVHKVCSVFEHNPVTKASSIERCRRWWNHHTDKRGHIVRQYLPTDWRVAQNRGITVDEWRVAMGYPTEKIPSLFQPNYTPPSEVKPPQPSLSFN